MMPIYSMQIQLLPKQVCNKIDSLTRGFIWANGNSNRGWSMVKWDIMTSPRRFGGMGIRDTKMANIAMVGKLIWNLLHDKHKLWVQVLSHKYLANGSVWNAPHKANTSATWRSIAKVILVLRDGFSMRFGSGDTSFWYTDLTGKGPIFHRLSLESKILGRMELGNLMG